MRVAYLHTCKSGLVMFAGHCCFSCAAACIPTPTAVAIAIQFAAYTARLIIIALQRAYLRMFMVRQCIFEISTAFEKDY